MSRVELGRPVIKEPVWTWEVPFYFFSGGLAGASAGLAFLAGQAGNEGSSDGTGNAALVRDLVVNQNLEVGHDGRTPAGVKQDFLEGVSHEYLSFCQSRCTMCFRHSGTP